jgi:hypothetical protein
MEIFEYETVVTAPSAEIFIREPGEDEEELFLKGLDYAQESNRKRPDWQWQLESNAATGYQWGCITLHFGKELLSHRKAAFLKKNVEYVNRRHQVLYLARKADTKTKHSWAMEELRKLMWESVDPTEQILATLEVAKLGGYMDEREYRGFVRHVERVLCPQ